jgi:acetyl esterase/lipase
MTSFNLEQPARELTEAIAKGPALSGVSLAEARKAVEAAQSAPISMPDVDESWVAVSSPFRDFKVRIVRPPGSTGPLPVILYMHGGGWILGSWITEQGADGGFDTTRIALAGASAGGNMSTVLALMAKQRGSVQFIHQSLYYPMTDANAEDSESLWRFKDGPYGSVEGLEWFWNSYLTAEQSRSDILVSPLQVTLTDLEGLPPALVIMDENDVLRDQGEAYADKLRDAGVPTTSVRFNDTIHDFMRLQCTS